MAEKQYVYLLWYEGISSSKLIGVFSSEEAAKKRKKGYTYWDQTAMSIEKEAVE